MRLVSELRSKTEVRRSKLRWCLTLLLAVIVCETIIVLLTVCRSYITKKNRKGIKREAESVTIVRQSFDSPDMKSFINQLETDCRLMTENESKKHCNCFSSDLVGRIGIRLRNIPEIGEMELQHQELGAGGIWGPNSCQARFRIAIIVPFRDRAEHLKVFLNHMHPFLQRQKFYYRIIVVEQEGYGIFNKATMMNIGFKEALRMGKFDCFIFHDVDMLPEDDRNLYICSSAPRHVGSHVDKWNYTLPYQDLFGGATAFTKKQFEFVNGYSNAYYGWGGEDDDMFRRVKFRKFNIIRYPKFVSRYTMIRHASDAGNPHNTLGSLAWRYRPHSYTRDGLNSLVYKRVAMEERPLYTWVLAKIATHRNRFYWRHRTHTVEKRITETNSMQLGRTVVAFISWLFFCIGL